MTEKLLPIGSVVLLKDSTQRVMIIGVCQKEVESGDIYDYAGCLFPQGYINPDKVFLFQHEQIVQLFSVGYQNEEQMEFKRKADLVIEEIKNKKVE